MLTRLVLLFLIFGLMVPQNFVNTEKTSVPAIHLDKESYSLYSRVSISIFAPEADKDPLTAEKIYVDIETKKANLIGYALTEIGSRSGNFSGHITLTGPDGITEGKGPFDGKIRADRGDHLLVSYLTRSGELITASASIDYHIGKLFFERDSYSEVDTYGIRVRVILIDEDLNADPENQDVLDNQETMLLLSGQEDGKLYFANINYIYMFETDVNSGIFVGYILNGECDRCVGLNENGDTLPFLYHDVTLPEPYNLTQGEQDNGIWIFAIVPYRGTSVAPVSDPAYLFVDDWRRDRDLIVKTQSAIRDMKFLMYDKKLEFINAAQKAGTVEMQIPKKMFEHINSVRINYTETHFKLRTDANYFHIEIKYPPGTNYIEILDTDSINPIELLEPDLVSQSSALRELMKGDEIIVQSELTNHGHHDHSFVYIVQVKDSEGVTQFLDSVEGVIKAGESLKAALTWSPESAGSYSAETFVWSELKNPSSLASSQRTTLRVTEDGHEAEAQVLGYSSVVFVMLGETSGITLAINRLELVEDSVKIKFDVENVGKENVTLDSELYEKLSAKDHLQRTATLMVEDSSKQVILREFEHRAIDLVFKFPAKPDTISVYYKDIVNKQQFKWKLAIADIYREFNLVIEDHLRIFYCVEGPESVGGRCSSPRVLNVNLGDIVTIRLRNNDNRTHDLYIEELGIRVGPVEPNKTSSLSFKVDTPGRFDFHDTLDKSLHASFLAGVLIVNARVDQIGDYSLSVNPNKVRLRPNESANLTITIKSFKGFSYPIYLELGAFCDCLETKFVPSIINVTGDGEYYSTFMIRVTDKTGGWTAGTPVTLMTTGIGGLALNGLLDRATHFTVETEPPENYYVEGYGYGSVRVNVLNDNGSPVRSALVEALYENYTRIAAGLTADDGSIAFNVPEGPVIVAVGKEGYLTTSATIYVNKETEFVNIILKAE